MTLNISAKNWLAQNAGFGNCFAPSGIAYKDGDGVSHTGSTGDVLNAFYVSHMAGTDAAIIIAGTNYTGLKSINGGYDVDMIDVGWVYGNDGDPVPESKYCYTSTPTPTPSVGSPGGIVTLYGIPTGEPEIELGVIGIEMKQSMDDYHFEINKLGLRLKDGSQWPCVAAVLIKLFSGAQASCPQSGEVFFGADRVSKTAVNPFGGEALPGEIRIKELYPGEVYSLSTDFYQPSSIVGVHTVCIYIMANWTADMLNDELKYLTELE